MSSINFPVLLLLAFLVLNLVVGVIKGRGVNTVKDFAVGNKNFGAKVLAMTFLATSIGGYHVFGLTKNLVSIGLIALIGFVFHCFSYIIIGYCFTNQISRFVECISFGDFIEQTYGNAAKCFSGLFSGLFSICSVAFQIQILGSILNTFWELDLLTSIIFSATIISIYTSFGGMRSVVATDVLQFIMIYLILLLLTYFTIKPALHNSNTFHNILSSRLLSTKSLNVVFFASRIPVLIFLTTFIEIPEFQRMLMAQNRICVKKMYLYSFVGKIISGSILVIITIASTKILGDQIDTVNTFNFIIKKFVPINWYPVVGLGLISVIFSTADSYLHASGMCLSKDFLEPLIKRNIKLIEVRFITLLCGIISTIIVLWFNGFLNLISLDYFMAPILVVPVLYGFLGLKTSNRMFWSSAAAGFLGAVTSGNSETFRPFCVFIGCCTSLITYFLVHVYENEGFNFIGKKIFYKSPTSGLWKFQLPPKERLIINLEKALNRNYNLCILWYCLLFSSNL